MISENAFIIQIEIVVADFFFVISECIVKCRIQMIILSVDSNYIPGMPVLDFLVRICLRQRNDTPDIQLIGYGFCPVRGAYYKGVYEKARAAFDS